MTLAQRVAMVRAFAFGFVVILLPSAGCSDPELGSLQYRDPETYQCGEIWDLSAGITCKSEQICGSNPLNVQGLGCLERCVTNDECSDRQTCVLRTDELGACNPWERVARLPEGEETLYVQGCFLSPSDLSTPLELLRFGTPSAPALEVLLSSERELQVRDLSTQQSQSVALPEQTGLGGAGSVDSDVCLEFSLTRVEDSAVLTVSARPYGTPTATTLLEWDEIANAREITDVSFVTRSHGGSSEERPVSWHGGALATVL